MKVAHIFFDWFFSEFSCKNDYLLAIYDGTYTLAAARESYLPESFRKVDVNNPFFSLSLPPMLRVSEASLDIGLYSNNNLCNYV